MNKWLKRGIVASIVFLALVALGLVSLNYYMVKRGERVVIVGADKKVVSLGIPVKTEPDKVTEAYNLTQDQYGQSVREPKYIHDRILVNETDGAITAATGDGGKNIYSWQDITAYICVDANNMGSSRLAIPAPAKIEDLSHFLYIFYGEGVRGVVGEDGLKQFRADRIGGEFVKLYPASETKDANGKLQLVGVVLFARHGCSDGGGK
ncbi:MAG: hypothetical protein WCL07_01545 [bacterium]